LSKKGRCTLTLANDYKDYALNINTIRIAAMPSVINGVEVVNDDNTSATVKNNVITFEPALSIPPAQEQSIDLMLDIGRMPSLQAWFTGLGDQSKLTFNIHYNDGHGRDISDWKGEASVKFKPSDRLLCGVLILGLLMGTGTKVCLEALRKQDAITTRGVAKFVLFTLVIGLVTALIALVGQIQIIAFNKVDLSYDVPGATFVIGFAAAISGVHLLNNWMNNLGDRGGATS
jgi:hypothetical protein